MTKSKKKECLPIFSEDNVEINGNILYASQKKEWSLLATNDRIPIPNSIHIISEDDESYEIELRNS